MPPLAQQKADIMENFAFDTVADTMSYLRWEWSMGSSKHIPDCDEIKRFASKFMDGVIERYEKGNLRAYSSTGGFETEVVNGELVLRFVLTYYPELGCLAEDEEPAVEAQESVI